MIEALVTARGSPFFQRFQIMRLGAFTFQDAIRLLVEQSPEHRPIDPERASAIVAFLGGHPFYLQLAGEALVLHEPPYDAGTTREVLQALVFSRTGRLGLFFENEYRRLVGSATSLATTLLAVASSPGGAPSRLTDIAVRAGASTASTARYLERLGDAVERNAEGLYTLADPVFAAWLRWRSPGGTVVPMRILGDEAERAVAEHLAALGFDLVYQSRASKGAFDLLALRGASQLGVQVKRGSFPLRFSRTEWRRMGADAERLGWRWVVAQVDPKTETVLVLDPARARAGREVSTRSRGGHRQSPPMARWGGLISGTTGGASPPSPRSSVSGGVEGRASDPATTGPSRCPVARRGRPLSGPAPGARLASRSDEIPLLKPPGRARSSSAPGAPWPAAPALGRDLAAPCRGRPAPALVLARSAWPPEAPRCGTRRRAPPAIDNGTDRA